MKKVNELPAVGQLSEAAETAKNAELEKNLIESAKSRFYILEKPDFDNMGLLRSYVKLLQTLFPANEYEFRKALEFLSKYEHLDTNAKRIRWELYGKQNVAGPIKRLLGL